MGLIVNLSHAKIATDSKFLLANHISTPLSDLVDPDLRVQTVLSPESTFITSSTRRFSSRLANKLLGFITQKAISRKIELWEGSGTGGSSERSKFGRK